MNAALPLATVDATATAAFLALAAHAIRHRDRPGAASAGLLWAALTAATAALAVNRANALGDQTALWLVVAAWIAAVAAWTAFACSYTGRGPAVTRRAATLAACCVAITAAATVSAGSVTGPLGALLRVSTSVLQTTVISAGLFGVFLVVRAAIAGDLPAGLAGALSIGGLAVSLLLFSMSVVDAGNPSTLPAATSAYLAVAATGYVGATLRYDLFGGTPGATPLARRVILEEMTEAVVVVDRERRLVDANRAAEDALGVTVASDAGQPVADVLGFEPAAAAEGTTHVDTPTGRRTVAVSESPLTNDHGDEVGTSYRLADVTDVETRKQRLEVFDRVLRHNLRNDLDAVRGFAGALADDAPVDGDDVTRRIRQTATGLVDVGDSVARANHLMTRDQRRDDRVDAVALARDVAADVREHADCELSVSASTTGIALRTDRAVLRTALLEVTENAVEHSNQPRPTATIAVSASEERVRFTVRDDGPGIPERERAVLLEGEETPLEHGSGVGLWLVSWAVTRLGGHLTIHCDDAGSQVVVDLPGRIHSDPL
ncbi:sensor histidine kinase [Halobacterium yunchengense]|uniref:sensor histidine kinase n=1 Tax=Halobacterium yunchengense TaxID=3108497 RepID=UPI0030080BD6